MIKINKKQKTAVISCGLGRIDKHAKLTKPLCLLYDERLYKSFGMVK